MLQDKCCETAPSKKRYGNGEREGRGGGGGSLEIIQRGFPLGDLAENSVLTTNDKKHEAGCLALESHYRLDPFLQAHPDWGAV